VSVIVPVRDRAELLEALLTSLAAQTYRDFEVIVVDDASTDDSPAVVEHAAARGEPVQLLRQPHPVGAVGARVAGVAVARGEVLAFTDSDCRPQPEWLSALVAAIDRGADVVQGMTRSARPAGPLERTVASHGDDGLYATCNVAYRRSAFDAVGGFDTGAEGVLGFRSDSRAKGLGFGEDSLLGWRVRRRGPSVFEPSAVVEHHVFPFEAAGAVSRAWQAGAFPALVREIPELRGTLLHRRVLLGRRRQEFLLLAVVLALLRRPGLAVLALCPWVWHHANRVDRSDSRWPARVAVLLGLEVVTESALVAGSARARTVVL
jgi:glycosyltransferase involved in cell wall biosynthesis